MHVSTCLRGPRAPSKACWRRRGRVAACHRRCDLPPGTAATVDAMRPPPVRRRAIATARFLALDLIAAALLLAGVAAAILIWYPARVGLLAAVAVVGLISLSGSIGALRFRRVSEAAQLHRTAERISKLFKVPYVAFGHSHAAGTWPLANGTTYV